MFKRISNFSEAIKFQESVFALPFAFAGMILSQKSLPTASDFAYITIAMICARTFGMAVNRIIDRNIDAINPRTAGRHLPQGILKVRDLLIPALIAGLLFFYCAYQLNTLALILSPIALAYLVFYPFTKRFTWAANILLGWALAIAPSGAWIGVTGQFGITPFLLSLSVAFWAGSFDILYHTQDIEFQQKHGLHSIAKTFGIKKSFLIAKSMDLAAIITLVIVGYSIQLNAFYFTGCLVSAGLLIYKYILVKPHDLSKLGIAFMRINAFVSISMFIATLLAIL